MRFRVMWVEPERGLKLLNRIVSLAFCGKKHAIIVMEYARSGSRLRSQLKLCARFFFAVKKRKNASIFRADFTLAWFSSQRLLQLTASFIEPRLRGANLA